MTKKEYILDFLKEINYAYNHPAMYDDLKRLLDEMEEEILESANCKWIPVTERLPDKLKNVLIVIEEEEVCEVAYMRNTYNATYKANGAKYEFVLSTGVTYAYYEVDAWMPIEPYGGDEK